MAAGIEHAHRIEIEALDLRDTQHGGTGGFGHPRGHGVLEVDDGEPFGGSERDEEIIEIVSRIRGAVENLIGGVVFDFDLSGAAGPFLLLQVRIEIPRLAAPALRCGAGCGDWRRV